MRFLLRVVENGDVTPCSLVKVHQIVEEIYCLNLEGGKVSQASRQQNTSCKKSIKYGALSGGLQYPAHSLPVTI
jgi:hypothetical protein